MTDHEVKSRLAHAIEETAPNDLDDVLSRCETQKGAVTFMKKTTKKFSRSLIAACMALLLIGGSGGVFYQQANAVATVVSLDVNPSIELKVNRSEKVLSCTGLNEDAAIILADMAGGDDLKGTKLNVAVNAIVGSLVSHGYLEDVSSAILISVEDKNQDRAARLQQELTASVDSALQTSAAQAAVLSQTFDELPQLEEQAMSLNISTGKAYLVRQVMEMNGTISLNSDTALKKLSALSIEELRDLLESGRKELPYDKSQAVQDVLEYAGLADATPIGWVLDPELDEATPHYEVEIQYEGKEYEYIVDAFTGQILSGPRDVLKNQTKPAVTPKPEATPKPDSSVISAEKAFDIAAADFYSRYPEVKGSNIFNNHVKLDYDNGKSHYDVEFYVDGYDVDYEIDAATGKVLEWDAEYELTKTEPKPTPKPAPTPTPKPEKTDDIGADAAKAAALSHAGLSASQVTGLRAERDMEHGRLEYEVDFRSGGMEYEYTIDGATGAVLEHEKEYDD